MKRILCILVGLTLLLSACGIAQPPDTDAETTAATTVPETTELATVPPVETTVPTEATQPTETNPPPAEGPAVEDVIRYFNEVCLDAEFTDGGDASLVQKWETPISYRIYGAYTSEDLEVIKGFEAWLNTVEGFPGMGEAPEGTEENLSIYFCEGAEFEDHLGEQYVGLDGGITFWYDGENRIYDAIICYRKDMDRQTRNSVILEEIYNGLGPVQDTELRPDSLIYAGFSTPQELTDIDRLLLRLLYHPSITCGMDEAQCETQLRLLYPAVIGLD